MASDAVAPGRGEVRAVAELLGHRPDELTSIKVPSRAGAGTVLTELTQMPELEDLAPPERIKVEWSGGEGDEFRFAARYDSPEGGLIVVSHETGPEIFFVLCNAAAAAATVIRAVHDLIRWIQARGPDPNGEPVQFWFVEDGQVKTREVLPLETPEQ